LFFKWTILFQSRGCWAKSDIQIYFLLQFQNFLFSSTFILIRSSNDHCFFKAKVTESNSIFKSKFYFNFKTFLFLSDFF
jgi:hypothetical protein